MQKPPTVIVVDMGDAVKAFMDNTMGIVSKSNLREIVTQIIQVMLNGTLPFDEDIFHRLPDFNRMTQIPSDAVPFVTAQSRTLARVTYDRLIEHQAFPQGSLDYFFDGFLGTDLVLHILPH